MTFNLFESFFLMSLGITFSLILILFYHFKERIRFIENKTDNLFSLIQDLAEELKKPNYDKLNSGSPYNVLNIENQPGSPFVGNVALDQVLIGTDLKNFENNLEEVEMEEDVDNIDELSDFVESDIEEEDDEKVIEDDDEEEDIEDDDENENFEKITIPDIKIVKQDTDTEQTHESNKRINFKKMHVGDLRAMIIEKGLCEDPSKMKKGELIELIKNHM